MLKTAKNRDSFKHQVTNLHDEPLIFYPYNTTYGNVLRPICPKRQRQYL